MAEPKTRPTDDPVDAFLAIPDAARRGNCHQVAGGVTDLRRLHPA
jgi:hypothetical protein